MPRNPDWQLVLLRFWKAKSLLQFGGSLNLLAQTTSSSILPSGDPSNLSLASMGHVKRDTQDQQGNSNSWDMHCNVGVSPQCAIFVPSFTRFCGCTNNNRSTRQSLRKGKIAFVHYKCCCDDELSAKYRRHAQCMKLLLSVSAKQRLYFASKYLIWRRLQKLLETDYKM